jgi:hypothetical protein
MFEKGRIKREGPRMDNIADAAWRSKPTAVYDYIDSTQFWVRTALSKDELKLLIGRCGKTPRVKNRRAYFDRTYVQRVRLYQPTDEALAWLARRNDIHLNYAEIASDRIFDDSWAVREDFEFICQFHVKPHHRDQGVRFAIGKRRRGRGSLDIQARAAPQISSSHTPTAHANSRANSTAHISSGGSSGTKQ